jgi:hypothetical protein
MRRDLSRTRRGHSPREGWELQPPGTYHVAGGEAEAEAGVHGDRAPWGELESLLRRWCRLGGSWHSCAALLRAHWAATTNRSRMAAGNGIAGSASRSFWVGVRVRVGASASRSCSCAHHRIRWCGGGGLVAASFYIEKSSRQKDEL